MNKKIVVGLLSVLLVFSMACSAVANLLGSEARETPEVEPLVMNEGAQDDSVPESLDEDDEMAEEESTEMGEGGEEVGSMDDEEAADESPGIQGGVVTNGPCYNPYFPIIEGRTLVYQNKIEEVAGWDSSHEMGFRDVSDEEFTAVFQYYEVDIEGNRIADELVEVGIKWLCSEEGLQQQEFMFGTFGIVEESVEISYETAEFEGITFPAEEDMEVGAVWESTYVIEMTTTVEGTTVSSVVDIHQVNTVVGFEEVSVLYGDFAEAVRVDSISEMVMTASADGSSFTVESDSTLSAWYVRDVGMVKQISYEDDAYTYIQELSDIK